MMNVGDPAGQGILDRHHCQIGSSVVDGLNISSKPEHGTVSISGWTARQAMSE